MPQLAMARFRLVWPSRGRRFRASYDAGFHLYSKACSAALTEKDQRLSVVH